MSNGLFNIQQIYADMMDTNIVEDPFTKYSNKPGIDPLTAMALANMDKNRARMGLFSDQQKYNRAVANLDPNAADYDDQMMSIAQKHRPGYVPTLRAAQTQAEQEAEDRRRKMHFEDKREERAAAAEERAATNHEWQTKEHERLLTEYEEGRASRQTVAAYTKSYLINHNVASLEDLEGLSDQAIIDLRTAISTMDADQHARWLRNLEVEREKANELDRRGLEKTIDNLAPLPEGALQDGSLAAIRSYLDNTKNASAFAAYTSALKSFEDAKAREAAEIARAAASGPKPSAQQITDTLDSSLEYVVSSGGFNYMNHDRFLGIFGSDKPVEFTNMADLKEAAKENGDLNARLTHITAELRADITDALSAGYSPHQAAQYAAEKAAGIPLGGIGDSVTVPGRETPQPASPSESPLNVDELADKDLRDTWLERFSRNGLNSFLGAAMFDAVGGPKGWSMPHIPTRTEENIQKSAERDQMVIDRRNAAIRARQQEQENARLRGAEEREMQENWARLQSNMRPRR